MCEIFNELTCELTMSTINNPDTTLLAGEINDNFQFRGILGTNGVTLTSNPDTVLIASSPIPLKQDISVTGLFAVLDYNLLNPVQQTQEQTFTLLSAYSNTGIFVGPNLTITVPGYYLINWNPTQSIELYPDVPSAIIYRIRSGATIYAEFYEQPMGNDEQTTNYSHVLLLPVGVYNFTIQLPAFSIIGYSAFLTDISNIGIKYLGN